MVSTALTGRERVSTAYTGRERVKMVIRCSPFVHSTFNLSVICNVRLAGDRNRRSRRFGCRRCGG